MDPNKQYVNSEHTDDRYLEDRASRSQVWQALVDIDQFNRHKSNCTEPEVEELRQPLKIVEMARYDDTQCREFMTLCRKNPGGTSSSCNFCGIDITKHSWVSFDREDDDGIVLPRWEPLHCSLFKLIEQVARDFFPGLKMALDLTNVHGHSLYYFVDHEYYCVLRFSELDDVGEAMAFTNLKLQTAERDEAVAEHMEYFTANLRGQRQEEEFMIMCPSLSVTEQFEWLRVWLARCDQRCDEVVRGFDARGIDTGDEHHESEHKECHEKSGPTICVAKRILDLTNADDGKVRLVEAEGLIEPYAALSHCWGLRHLLKTTHATLDEHMAGIAIEDLPRSFQDAIQVCLSIDVDYLWIDCLCIVQGDSAEWLQESEKMAAIYSDAYVTIAATRAKNSQHGFLRDFAQDLVSYEVKADAPWDLAQPERTLNATFQIDHNESTYDAPPLNKRAWCLQEWYMPKRLVEFRLNDVRFICLRGVRDRFGCNLDRVARTRSLAHFQFSDEVFFRSQWDIVREDYWGRRITYLSDRLPALAGLAQMLEKTLVGVRKHRYLAGLWSTRISKDLSWSVIEYDRTTEALEGIPSWSWASVTGDTGYIYHKPSRTFVDYIGAHCSGYARPKEITPDLTVCGFSTTLYMRVDHRSKGYDGRPHISFWRKPFTAMTTKTEEIEKWHNLLRQARTRKVTGCFVSDMPFAPNAHTHDNKSDGQTTLVHAPSVTRSTERQQLCTTCQERGYLTTVQLLLLTRTDACWIALVLAPVQTPEATRLSNIVPVYQRLGLMEVGYYTDPYVRTPDGHVTAWDTFWPVTKPEMRKTLTII